ncbi:GNAT family N-acetyltransferase [Variovorax sp. AB1(2024)]|uniref:GNAT family N-acetyltransferase n=1 Tax=Variovorax sp. AB1(2024) TaxID=3132214 RepID=UPI0030A3EF4F
MKIENATIEDVLPLVKLAVVMFNESPNYGRYNDFDGGKVFDIVTSLVTSENGIVIVCRDDSGEIVGGFVGGVDVMWFCRETKVMYDNALFIHPAHRGGMTAVNLLKEAFRQAKEKGASQAQVTNTTGVFSKHVERLYQYVGMEHVGGFYKLDL